jgi:cytidylate kinase
MKTYNWSIIAIDGPAASGKGTLSKKIAAAMGYAHMDTGLLYRAVALMVLSEHADVNDPRTGIKAAQALAEEGFPPTRPASPSSFAGLPPPNGGRGGGGGQGFGQFDFEPYMDALKDEAVTAAASVVAANPEVRNILLNLQKTFAAAPPAPYKGAVLDGRDIGTVICPDAPVKLYITANLETRAERRFKELQSKGNPVTYDAVLRDMRDRDSRDSGRASAPMKPAIDAVILDTTDLNQDQAFEKALAVVREKTRINSNP